MTDRLPSQTTNIDGYGFAELLWSRPRDVRAAGAPGRDTPMFLGTVRPDGTPHAAGIGAVWYDGDLYFTNGPATRKARNLVAQPACTISTRLAGIDLVFEGKATRVTDPTTLAAVVAIFSEGGWPAKVQDDGFTAPFSAPSAGPPPWHLYRFTFHTVFGVATVEPYGATRWRFER